MTTINQSMSVGEDRTFMITAASQDITGWHLAFYLYAPGDPQTQYLEKDNGVNGGLTISNAAQGQIQVSFLKADTIGFLPGQLAYSVWRTDVPSETALVSGLFTLGIPSGTPSA